MGKGAWDLIPSLFSLKHVPVGVAIGPPSARLLHLR
ncbi:hypothetical protein SLEP1_g9233 [Rubroshorea leprosula]|uniref:Uncharacterized protein n=1 Tax=Rubroshorea leprosula TaxID=152421 RepID=A0AAV5IA97_9ROSI|nr:hypothetical protein SLEP1_g9233 [Rubroshorea leprosula]